MVKLNDEFGRAIELVETLSGYRMYFDPSNPTRNYISMREQVTLTELTSHPEFWRESADYAKLAEKCPEEDGLVSELMKPELAATRTTELDNIIALKNAQFAREIELNQSQPVKVNVRLTPNDEGQPVYKFVPLLTELPQQVRELKPSDIISLFDDAELEMWLLWLARVLIGRNNVLPLGFDEPIAHAMRVSILMLSEPGSGKSTLMQSLMSGISKLGYKTTNFQSLSGRFNNGSILMSDLSYVDDLTVKQQKDLLSSDLFKSAVTGALIRVEDKGRDAVQTFATSAFAFCSNEVDESMFTYNLDAGVVDRLKVLRCKTEPAEHQVERLQRLSRELGVSTDVLMWRLCRHAIDLFFSKFRQGHEWEFQQYIKDLSFKLEFQVLKNFSKSLVDYIVLAQWLKTGVAPSPVINNDILVEYLRDFIQLSISENNREYRNSLKQIWVDSGRNDKHVWFFQTNSNLSTVVNAWHQLNQTLGLNPKVSTKKLIVDFFGSVYSTSGSIVENRYAQITQMLGASCADHGRFQSMLSKLKGLTSLTPVWNSGEPTNISYVLNNQYNPKVI